MAFSRYFRPARGKPAADSGDASPKQPEQNTSLDTLFTEVGKMSATLLTVALDVSTIKQTTAELENAVNAMQVRLTEAEGRFSDIEDTTQQLVTDRELQADRYTVDSCGGFGKQEPTQYCEIAMSN